MRDPTQASFDIVIDELRRLRDAVDHEKRMREQQDASASVARMHMAAEIAKLSKAMAEMQPVVGTWADTTSIVRLGFKSILGLAAVLAAILGIAKAFAAMIAAGWHTILISWFR